MFSALSTYTKPPPSFAYKPFREYIVSPMRSFSRQLRDVAHRSFAALRPHRYEDVYAVDAASTSMHILLPEDNSDHLVKINLSHGSHDSSEVNSASSSSSSLEMLDKPAVRFAHVPLEDPAVTAAVSTLHSSVLKILMFS